MAEVLPSETAEEWKNTGNDFYKSKNYSGAATAYSKAIDLDPTNALLFTNRAAAYLMSLLYKEALNDCDSAIKLDSSCSKAYFRKATALKGLGRLDAAIEALSRGLEYDPASITAQKEKDTLVSSKEKIGNVRTLMSQRQYSAAMRQCDVLIKDIGAAFPEITLLRAECLLNLSRPEEAFNLSNVLMKAGQAGDVSLLSLRARCLVMMGDLDNAFRHLQTAVRSDPDNTTIRAFYRSLRDIVDGKNSGDDSFKRQSYDDAVRSYSQALDSFKALGVKCKDFEAKIYLNRATSYHKIRRNEDGLKDCNMAISLKDDYVKAYIRRAECFQALGGPDNIERAISDLEKARELETEEESQSSLEHKIKKAKVLLKRSKRKDLYAVLGVTPDASDSEIKSAYRKAALRYHPDKQSSKSDAEKAEAETKFKEVGEAYEILTNPEKKARYDEGVDLEDLDNPHAGGSAGGFGGEMDPNMLFHMFMQQQQQQRGRGGRGGFGGFNDY